MVDSHCFDRIILTSTAHKEHTVGKEKVFELFLKDMEQPVFQLAIYRSFKRWADLRDQLIQIYVDKTGIPSDEFRTQIARQLAGVLTNS